MVEGNKAEKMDTFVEKHWNDPRQVNWEDVVEGLKIMGLDMSDEGDAVIDVEITCDHLVIKRVRRSVEPEKVADCGAMSATVLWSVTKDILMRQRKQ
jgi:hypothetical protein